MRAVFLDLETTGLDPLKHRMIEIAFRIVDLSSYQETAAYTAVVYQPDSIWELRDLNSIDVNGFKREEVLKGKTEAVVQAEVLAIFQQNNIVRGHAFFFCQNPSFDRAFLAQLINLSTQEALQLPYHWLDLASMYWAHLVRERRQEGKQAPHSVNLSKDSIAEHLNLPSESKPHRALNGVNHLINCYQALFK
jgi:DNA polymerase III, epsilon subunit and related 3''-5'' exonucleases